MYYVFHYVLECSRTILLCPDRKVWSLSTSCTLLYRSKKWSLFMARESLINEPLLRTSLSNIVLEHRERERKRENSSRTVLELWSSSKSESREPKFIHNVINRKSPPYSIVSHFTFMIQSLFFPYLWYNTSSSNWRNVLELLMENLKKNKFYYYYYSFPCVNKGKINQLLIINFPLILSLDSFTSQNFLVLWI